MVVYNLRKKEKIFFSRVQQIIEICSHRYVTADAVMTKLATFIDRSIWLTGPWEMW